MKGNTKVDTRANEKKVIYSFSWKLLERIVAQGVNFFIQLILARLLLQSDFASLAIIVAITNYAAIFVQNGLSTVIVQKEDLDDLDISTLFISSLFVASLMYLVLFCIAPLIAEIYATPVLKSALRVQGVQLFLYAINAIQLGILQRYMKFKDLFIRSIIAIPIAGVISIAMAYMGFGVWSLIIFNLLNPLITIIVIVLRRDVKFELGFSIQRARILYGFCGKIMAAGLISGLFDTIRTMIVGKKYSSDDLANFDKAYTYSFYVVSIFGYSLSSVMLPVLSRQQSNVSMLKSTARKSICLSTYIMFPALLGVATLSKQIVVVLLTQKWESCAIFLTLFCLLRLPECMITIDKQAYLAIGRNDICLKYEVLLCTLNLSALLITLNHGITAVAIGAVIVELVAGCIIAIISQKNYTYKVSERLSDIFKPLINSILMCVVISLLKYTRLNDLLLLCVGIPLGAIVYLTLSYISKDENLQSLITVLKTFIERKK